VPRAHEWIAFARPLWMDGPDMGSPRTFFMQGVDPVWLSGLSGGTEIVEVFSFSGILPSRACEARPTVLRLSAHAESISISDPQVVG
jgi:hypothetical protein